MVHNIDINDPEVDPVALMDDFRIWYLRAISSTSYINRYKIYKMLNSKTFLRNHISVWLGRDQDDSYLALDDPLMLALLEVWKELSLIKQLTKSSHDEIYLLVEK